MNIVLPTKDQIMTFFKNHTGFFTVLRISELLVSHDHNNVQDEEWKHVRRLLHSLKADDFLLVKNEGEDIHNERFSATPNRIERYFSKVSLDIENLSKKTEEDLVRIIRERVGNQHLPHSVYHKAKQELGLREKSEAKNIKTPSWKRFSMDNPIAYLLMTLVLFFVTYFFNSKKIIPDKDSAPASIHQAEASLNKLPEDIYSLLDDMNARSKADTSEAVGQYFKKYIGLKTGTAKGYVEDVSSFKTISRDSVIMVSLLSLNHDNKKLDIDVFCNFDKKLNPVVSVIQKGKEINFSGVISQYESGSIILEGCTLE